MGEFDNKKQDWLIPEVGESIEKFKALGIGAKTEGDIFRVPNIIMDEAVRKELQTWPLEISSRRIVNNKPFAMFAELGPKVLFDFKDLEAEKVEFRFKGRNCVEMELTLKSGRVVTEQLTLQPNGKIKQGWGSKIEQFEE